MPKKTSDCCIYGPDLDVHENQAKEIANTGLKCMRGLGATGKEEKSTGPETSKNNLENLR
jgi:hypothetical protein